jgi:hypothetical protein
VFLDELKQLENLPIGFKSMNLTLELGVNNDI